MLSKGRPLDTTSSLLSPCPSLRFPDHASDRNVAWEAQGARAEISARSTRAYPSPPMSGAPAVPLHDPREQLYKQSRGSSSAYSATTTNEGAVEDVCLPKRPVDVLLHLPPPQQAPLPPPAIFPSPYQQRPPPAMMGRAYNYLASSSDGHSSHSSPYALHEAHPQQQQQETKQSQSAQHFAAVAAAAATHPRSRASESNQSGAATSADGHHQVVGSPKTQRKTKGHVASACVPCKRAHLRCDAQRPCSRCISNGKEDACVDVQHKKRGRPRLRDDRDARFENVRHTHGHSLGMSPRRPIDIHPCRSSGTSFDDHYPQRRPPSFRSVDMAAGGGEQRHPAPSCDLNSYYAPLAASSSSGSSPEEPVAYLTMSLEFVKGSASFWDAIGLSSMAGRNLGDIVLPGELDKVATMHSYFNNEQRTSEPNYLPPILGRGYQNIHRLGFAVEDFGRFALGFQGTLAFVAEPGRFPRSIPIRAGLAKEGSFYFVVLLLSLPQPLRLHQPQPHQHPHQHQHQHPHQHPHQQQQQQQQYPGRHHLPSSVANAQQGPGSQTGGPYQRVSPPGALLLTQQPSRPSGPFDPVKAGVGQGEAGHHAATATAAAAAAAAVMHREHPSSSSGPSSSRPPPPHFGDYGFPEDAGRSRPYRAVPEQHVSEGLQVQARPREMLKEQAPAKQAASRTPPSTFQLPPIRPHPVRGASSGAGAGAEAGAGTGGYDERHKRLAIDGLLGNSDEPYRPREGGRRR